MARNMGLQAPNFKPVEIFTNVGPPNEVFVSQKVFPPQLRPYLSTCLRQCASQKRALITIICANKSEPWLRRVLSSELRALPLPLFDHLSPHGRGQSAAAMPYYDGDGEIFTFLLNYPSTSPVQNDTHSPALVFEEQIINFHGVAAMIIDSNRLDDSRAKDEHIIILYMTDSAILPLISKHLGGDNSWRMNRLHKCPFWLYIDLLQGCNRWSNVWSATGQDLARRNTLAYRATSNNSTLKLSRKLHRATSNVITLRENLRLHISSTERFQKYVSKRDPQAMPLDEYQDALIERTEDILQGLRHHWDTSNVILEQFKSLMSLVFNVETVVQTQAVARLNLLAFAFLPLSFVSGIFGMTTWNISAVWYPLWAFIVFLLVVTAAYVGGKISIENENGKYSLSDFRWDSGSNHGKDAESPNQRRLRRSTSIGSVIMGPTAVVSTKIPYEVDEDLPQRWDSYRRKARGSRRAKRLSLRERGASGGIPQSGVHEVYNPPVPVQTLSPETEEAPHEEAAEYSSDESRIPQQTPSDSPVRVFKRSPPSSRSSSRDRSYSKREGAFQTGVTLAYRADEVVDTDAGTITQNRTPPDVVRRIRVPRMSNNRDTYQEGLSLVEE